MTINVLCLCLFDLIPSSQIYAFGGVSIFLDQSVAFTEMPRGSGQWSPLGLDDLLALTGNAPAAAAKAAAAAGASTAPGGAAGGASQTNGGGSHGFGGLD